MECSAAAIRMRARRAGPMATGVGRANGAGTAGIQTRCRMPAHKAIVRTLAMMAAATDIVTVTAMVMATAVAMAVMAGHAADMATDGAATMVTVVAGATPDMAATPVPMARATLLIADGDGRMADMLRL